MRAATLISVVITRMMPSARTRPCPWGIAAMTHAANRATLSVARCTWTHRGVLVAVQAMSTSAPHQSVKTRSGQGALTRSGRRNTSARSPPIIPTIAQ